VRKCSNGISVKCIGFQQEAAGDGRAMRILSAAGNTILLAALGTSAYFGYYTLRYSTAEVQDLVDERKKPENDFPARSVRPYPVSRVSQLLVMQPGRTLDYVTHGGCCKGYHSYRTLLSGAICMMALLHALWCRA
jgi:hypothetical protein